MRGKPCKIGAPAYDRVMEEVIDRKTNEIRLLRLAMVVPSPHRARNSGRKCLKRVTTSACRSANRLGPSQTMTKHLPDSAKIRSALVSVNRCQMSDDKKKEECEDRPLAMAGDHGEPKLLEGSSIATQSEESRMKEGSGSGGHGKRTWLRGGD